LALILCCQPEKKTKQNKKPKSATPIKKGQDGKSEFGQDREFGNGYGDENGTGTRLAKCGTFLDGTVLGLISGFHAIAEKNVLHKRGGMGRKMQICM